MVVHKQLRLSLAYCLCQPLLALHIGGSPRSNFRTRPATSTLSRLKGSTLQVVQRKEKRGEYVKSVEAKRQVKERERTQKLLISVYNVTCSCAKECVSQIITPRRRCNM